ncbi:orotate phosphoribosyltransferase [Microvirga sp. 2MCAF35]|uniref:orotate phosphoribosyltransferase n=1 Tax=Microvirga sp. 2MCAF35 TaxID=3232987 RepID=UPI003F9C8E0A
MTNEEALAEIREAGGFYNGHFILKTGRHCPTFLQKTFIFTDPIRTERLCIALASKIISRYGRIDCIVSPALGGIIPGYEVARVLNAKFIFLEKENGELCLRRGFHIPIHAKVLLVEDVIYSGQSSRESLKMLYKERANVVGAACLIDRSGGTVDIGAPLVSLASFYIPDYSPDEIPPELAEIPPVTPGSRGIVKTSSDSGKAANA